MSMKGLTVEQKKEIIPDNTFLLGWRGSVAHGTYTPKYGGTEKDDKDLIGVCFGPLNSYLGLGKFEQIQKGVESQEGIIYDSVVYEIRKYFRLLLKGNPNVLSLLWLPEHLYVIKDEIGQELIDNRDLFVGKHVYRSFCGYAQGQLHRMTHINTSDLGAKRKALVKRFGYDCKNGAHLIRLLRMGIEFLTEGELYIVRENATELIEIKNGEWPKEKVLKEADRLFKLAEEAYIRSPLPPKPDYDRINHLLEGMVYQYVKEAL